MCFFILVTVNVPRVPVLLRASSGGRSLASDWSCGFDGRPAKKNRLGLKAQSDAEGFEKRVQRSDAERADAAARLSSQGDALAASEAQCRRLSGELAAAVEALDDERAAHAAAQAAAADLRLQLERREAAYVVCTRFPFHSSLQYLELYLNKDGAARNEALFLFIFLSRRWELCLLLPECVTGQESELERERESARAKEWNGERNQLAERCRQLESERNGLQARLQERGQELRSVRIEFFFWRVVTGWPTSLQRSL